MHLGCIHEEEDGVIDLETILDISDLSRLVIVDLASIETNIRTSCDVLHLDNCNMQFSSLEKILNIGEGSQWPGKKDLVLFLVITPKFLAQKVIPSLVGSQ